MKLSNDKDFSIHEVVTRLSEELGDAAFDLVDHWESDLCAIGLARPDNHAILVYISTWKSAEQTYYAELELPAIEEDLPYYSAGKFNNLDFDALLALVKRHLEI